MQKLLKISVILQIAYCVGCLAVVVCMLLCGLLPTEASEVLFDVGTVFFFISILNPCGAVCSFIANPMLYMLKNTMQNLRGSPRFKLWLFLGPVLVVLCWLVAIIFFVLEMKQA